MTTRQAIEDERERIMAPNRPWFTGEPCVRLPLSAVLIDHARASVYITLADLAKAMDGEHQAPAKEGQ